MATKQNNTECATLCWAIAASAGLVAMLLLYWLVDFGFLQALFTGGLFGVFLGLVLNMFMCRTQPESAQKAIGEAPVATQTDAIIDARIAVAKAPERQATETGVDTSSALAAAEGNAGVHEEAYAVQDDSAPAGTMADVTGTTAERFAADEKFVMQPSKKLAGQDELAARKGDWKYVGDAATRVSDAAPATKQAPVAKDGRPVLLDGPRAEGKDDLKLISGVGPKLEETLNSLGIYHFDQVANWRKKEIAWVDSNLRFKGRIERDDWMKQARILAEGGQTEFSKKKKKS